MLAAGIGNVPSVRRPVELLCASERFGRKFVWLVPEYVETVLFAYRC